MLEVELEWPVRRVVQIVTRDEIDWHPERRLPRGWDPLEIPADLRAWDQAWPDYEMAAPAWILANVWDKAAGDGLWLPPWRQSPDLDRPGYRHLDGSPVRIDGQGRPLNPRGRQGRNVYSGWYWYPGANWATDGAVVCCAGGEWWVLMIQRADSGAWALPGGMCDAGENPDMTSPREVEEETGFRAGPHARWRRIHWMQIGAGFAYNWIETGLYVCRVEPDRMTEPLTPQPGEADDACWLTIDDAMRPGRKLNGGHDELLTCLRQHLALLES
jgi:8-oxo-dGTP pyrophosphatase MutT (NUDIX family)